MSIIKDLVTFTERADGLNGLSQAISRFDAANNPVDVAAAASQILAELAVAGAITATVRPAMSSLRLGLALSGNIWKWEALTTLSGIAGGITAGTIIDYVNEQSVGSKIYDWRQAISPILGTTPDPLGACRT